MPGLPHLALHQVRLQDEEARPVTAYRPGAQPINRKDNNIMQSNTNTAQPIEQLAAEVRRGDVVLRDLDDDQLDALLGWAQAERADPGLYAACYAHVDMRRAIDHAEEMDRAFGSHAFGLILSPPAPQFCPQCGKEQRADDMHDETECTPVDGYPTDKDQCGPGCPCINGAHRPASLTVIEGEFPWVDDPF